MLKKKKNWGSRWSCHVENQNIFNFWVILCKFANFVSNGMVMSPLLTRDNMASLICEPKTGLLNLVEYKIIMWKKNINTIYL